MERCGLVSVSFRSLSPEAIVKATVEAGLSCIEWGSDIHAPCEDADKLSTIAALQAQYGIRCCSYGTYFRLGVTPLTELPKYIDAAKRLRTNILRLWCGSKSAEEHTEEERCALLAVCREAAQMAEKADVILCMECHMKTFTQTKEGALELMQQVNSPAFRMYWQPNQFREIDENLAYARLLKEYVTHIHVFQWKGKDRFPLDRGIEEWKRYLNVFPEGHHFLLEFMPDDDVCSLAAEAAALHKLIGESI